MGEAHASRGGFITDLTLTTGVLASGCCGGSAESGSIQTLQIAPVSACCGEPVAVTEPVETEREETAPAAASTGCCGEPVAVVEPVETAQAAASGGCCGEPAEQESTSSCCG